MEEWQIFSILLRGNIMLLILIIYYVSLKTSSKQKDLRCHMDEPETSWKPPSHGSLQLDVDTSFNQQLNSFAIGGVI